MPLTLTSFSRWILTCAALLGMAATGTPALAQMSPGVAPPPPQQPGAQANPICIRLEGQLAAVDRGASGGDPAKEEQIRRYQEAAGKQQAELDRVTLQAKRMGCESSGFFSLFNGQSAQCGPVNNQIQQMRGNLDQITTSLERLRCGGIGGADRENQRRSVLTALAQNNCGPQYANAVRGPGGFMDNLFGNNNATPAARRRHGRRNPAPSARSACAPATAPISRSRSPPTRRASRTTRKPARRCARQRKRRCSPIAIPAKTSTRRSRSAASPTRRCPTPSNSAPSSIRPAPARPPGQTWSDALKSVDDKASVEQQGDIIVTEESAKKMQQRAQPQPARRHRRQEGRRPAATGRRACSGNAGTCRRIHTGATNEKKPIRTVGPTFIPPKQ